MAVRLPYQPLDLRQAALFKNGSGEADIAKTLAEGVRITGTSAAELHQTHHELVMPKFDHLTALERRSIALYVISLRVGSVHP